MAHLRLEGELIRADYVLSMTVRSDLAPIPQTLEALIRVTPESRDQIKEGSILQAGPDGTEYRVMKALPKIADGGTQAGSPIMGVAVTCYLNKVHAIGYRRQSAVIKEGVTLGEIYSACGARIPIESDFRVDRFACLVGQVPSYAIAVIAQEEGGAIHWTGRGIRFSRLHELVRAKPILTIQSGTSDSIESEFQERHEVPWFFSTDEAGAFVLGDRRTPRAVQYAPDRPERVLRNMTRCLIHRHTVKDAYDVSRLAGQVISVDGKPHVIVTAAHQFSNGAGGSASAAQSQYWLSEVVG